MPVKVDANIFREYAHLWKNIDPKLYDGFLRNLSLYVSDVTVAVTEASSSEILQAQGRAQQAIKFLQLFTETREPTRPMPN